MTSPKDKSPRKSSKKKNTAKVARRLVFGSLISSDFFLKHWLALFISLLLVMIYISTKYQCQTSMETIKRLSNRLEVVKTERIRERSSYMSRIRESEMQVLADSIKPGLKVQQQPPYHISNK